MTSQHESASPTSPVNHGYPPEMDTFGHAASAGLTAIEHAAILLRVPTSGTPWLDSMILHAKRDDIAQAVLVGCLSYSHCCPQKGNWQENCADMDLAMHCFELAGTMLKAGGYIQIPDATPPAEQKL